jgi:ferrous iron transport protein A
MEKRLPEMRYEEEGKVIRIEGKVKEQVAGMGIRVGKEIKMMTKHPLKGPIVVTVNRSNTSFGRALAAHIIVEVK